MSYRQGWVVGLVLLMAVGCQSRLKMGSSCHLDATAMQDMEIDPPRYDQIVSISIEADEPVTIYVYRKDDHEIVLASIAKRSPQPKLLFVKEGVRNETIEVKIPAKEISIITLQAGLKPANVKLQIVGK